MVTTAVGTVGGGGWAAARDRPAVSSLGAGGVLAPVCRTRMVKRTGGARGVRLFATLGGVAQTVAVVGLGVPVGVNGFLNLEPF